MSSVAIVESVSDVADARTRADHVLMVVETYDEDECQAAFAAGAEGYMLASERPVIDRLIARMTTASRPAK